VNSFSHTTIAAIVSPPGTGGVSLLRLSGPRSREVAAGVFRGSREPTEWEPRRQHYGRLVDPGGETVDDVLLTWFPAPRSFTGEDVVEISCHGGILVTRKILGLLLQAGAESAAPGEFSQRAFLNGKLDLTQAEAIMDLISARTELAARAAREQLSGRLGNLLEGLRADLIGLVAHLEAFIDFPEEDIDPGSLEAIEGQRRTIAARIAELISTAERGRLLREGVKTVICGAPNAGKSSLLNLLLGFERAIVSERAGTTRDTIEEVLDVEGIPVRLVDTAGMRQAGEEIERQGIERTRFQLETAELALWVVDASAPASEGVELQFPEGLRVLRLLNKADLPRHPDWEGAEGLAISCLDPASDSAVRRFLFDSLAGGSSTVEGGLVAINLRHRSCLERAREALSRAGEALAGGLSPEFVSLDLREALEAVGEVVGKADVEEILGEIFGRFCIGK